MNEIYRIVGYVAGFLAFIVAWSLCAFKFSFVGFLAGWMPALIVGAIVAVIWPVVAIAGLIIGLYAAGNV